MTLTQTAIIVRQFITISTIALVLSIAGFIGYKIWYAYYLAHLPPIEEKPDAKFGILPALDFPTTIVSSANFSYSLDTVTGGLPKVGIDPGFEKFVKVYFVSQTFATLLSSERSQALAEKFNITTPAEILSETKYQFTDQDKTLLVDLDTGNFSYTKEATVSGETNLDDDNPLTTGFEQILSNLGVLKKDLSSGRTKVTLLKVDGQSFIPTHLRSESAAAEVSLWPAPIDKKSIFTADYNKSLVSAVVTGSTSDIENYLSLDFTDYPIDTTTFATYPVKSSDAAFDDLKNGQGLVVVEPAKPQVSIISVYLGYYLQKNYSPYLQPIFIFEGPSFVAYVPAISKEFTSYGHSKFE